MYNLYETISSLCEEKGIKPGRMCNELGISRGAITDLKAGRKQSLSAETLSKIATYFGVSVDYLLGSAQKEEPHADQIDLSDVELGFLGDYKELTEENKATVRDMVRLMRERQKEG
ncbi:helix-turn-helix domain-containing protein [Candidatus Allofournierella merdipullorum]|uniref:helix-turn-helix domain-containing protein n=1 Tax=Candidatus Allofournierella merdipullorum TaxID=2838595 RepID=UPI002A89DE93|nr:helix-turn-helix transcriptional regulator [Candidatus Fournierella merdipullorum]